MRTETIRQLMIFVDCNLTIFLCQPFSITRDFTHLLSTKYNSAPKQL